MPMQMTEACFYQMMKYRNPTVKAQGKQMGGKKACRRAASSVVCVHTAVL